MQRTITLHHWKKDSGYTHSEYFDHIDAGKDYTAEDWANDYNDDLSTLIYYDAVCIELEDEHGDIVSEHWVYKEN